MNVLTEYSPFLSTSVCVYLHEMHIYLNPVSLMSRKDVSLTAKLRLRQLLWHYWKESHLHGCLGALGYRELPALVFRERRIAGKGMGGQRILIKSTC